MAAVAALSCTAKAFDDEFALAVSVAVCAVVTHVRVAVKGAEDEPGGTVTLDGVITALLLLESATVWPPVGAVELSVKVQGSVPEPVNELLLQVRPLTVGAIAVPVPLSDTEAVEALLEIVSWPVTEPALVGSN